MEAPTVPEYHVQGGNPDVDENQPLVRQPGAVVEADNIKLYTRRWYILIMFSLLACSQGIVWNTWGPLAQSAEVAFGWNDGDIALLTNWGPITFIISAAPLAWMMDVKGLRWSAVMVGSLIFVGSGLRCIPVENKLLTPLIHIGQFLNGLGGPVLMGGPPLVSAVWFPANQRTTATALATAIPALGIAVSFIIGPLLVPAPAKGGNGTSATDFPWYPGNGSNHSSAVTPEDIRESIVRLMYIEFGFASLVFLIILVYYPAKPPSPPSVSASIARVDFKAGLLSLLRNKKFWTLGLVYAISNGVFNCWQTVLDINLKAIDVSEKEAGWLGCYGTIAGSIASVVIGRFADIFARRMRLFLVSFYLVSALMFLWIALLCEGFIPRNTVSLYVAMIVGSFCMIGAVPLFFELVCESTYPVAEGITNGFVTTLNNVAGLLFLLGPMVPHIGTFWMNWTIMGSVLLCVPVLVLFNDKYSRLEIDSSKATAESINKPEENE